MSTCSCTDNGACWCPRDEEEDEDEDEDVASSSSPPSLSPTLDFDPSSSSRLLRDVLGVVEPVVLAIAVEDEEEARVEENEEGG
eukprot:evm.model.NODE_36562_length_3719_cov_42.893520.2